MKRRKFLKQAGLTAGSVVAAPFILPSGRLFAASGSRLVNHVVLFLFAGGIRNQESVYQQYLLNQGAGPTGNIMPGMLSGAAPTSSLLYDPWTPVSPTPLSAQGTLFRHMRYAQGPTGHYNGHTVTITGNYTDTGLNLNVNPEFPTVFEYYRKHSGIDKTALQCWWLSNELGPYPSLNYSRHPLYGPQYGANYLQPLTALGELGAQYISGLASLHPEEFPKFEAMRSYLNANFDQEQGLIPGISNTEEDRQLIRQFKLSLLNGTLPIEYPLPSGVPSSELSEDLVNIAISWKVLEQFSPELTVVNTTNVDVCHDNFSSYIRLMHKADYGVAWLWNKIQSHPVLADDTILICLPEHGRNLSPNGLTDSNGLFAYDHTSDSNSRDIFGLVVGPSSAIKQGEVIGSESSAVGESIDIIPTIADILGFGAEIPGSFLPGRVLNEAFV